MKSWIRLRVVQHGTRSGGAVPVESEPDGLQPITFLFPSRPYGSFVPASSIAGLAAPWCGPEFALVAGLGLFRRSIARNT
jgi:hypothetical protein